MSPAPPSRVMQPTVIFNEIEDKTTSHDDQAFLGDSCNAAKLLPVPPNAAPHVPPCARSHAAYDECTIRMWYIEMDANANGTVSKEEFINYLRSRPQLQNELYSGLQQGKPVEQDLSPCSKPSLQLARAMGIKRIISVYKDMDVNKNGVVSWDEFLGFFQRKGFLLTYSTPDNPRDRMAAALAREYQRRQAVKNWQKGGAALGVGHKAGWEKLTEELTSKFLIEQKEQQVNTQWASERLKEMQDQHAHGRDAFSVVTESIDVLKEAARTAVGRPKSSRRCGIVQPDSTYEATGGLKIETHIDADLGIPTTARTMRPLTPLTMRPQTPKEQPDECKLMSAATPKIEMSSQPLYLPILLDRPRENWEVQQILLDSLQTCYKSPVRPKGKSCSHACDKSPVRRRLMTPRRTAPSATPMRHCTSSDLGQSPNNCGETPWQQVLMTSDVQ